MAGQPVFFHAGTAVSRLELSLSCIKCVRARLQYAHLRRYPAGLTRRRSTPEPTMLIGKTDPFVAVFTRGEKSEPWVLVGTTGAAPVRVATHACAIRHLRRRTVSRC